MVDVVHGMLVLLFLSFVCVWGGELVTFKICANQEDTFENEKSC